MKEMKHLEIDKQNDDMAFNEETHLYWNVKYPDRKYTSVTTLIGKFYEKFNADYWSTYKALEALLPYDFVQTGLKFDLLNKKEEGISEDYLQSILDTFNLTAEDFVNKKNSILTDYKVANEEACDRGTKYHLEKENRFYKSNNICLKDFDDLKLALDGNFHCEKHNFDLSRHQAILPEYLVYYSDGILNLAGQIDMLIKDGNDIYILDYKTNKKGIDSKAYFDKKLKRTKRMFYPINDIDDTTYNHYTLQLSIYAWMLQQINPNFNIKLLRLLHIDGEGKETSYDVPYLKESVERLVQYQRKQVIVDHYRKTGEMLK